MDLYNVVIGVSALISLLFTLFLAWDIITTIWARAKGKTHKWHTAGFFEEMDEWWKPALFAVVLIIGYFGIFEMHSRYVYATITPEIVENTDASNGDSVECPYCFTDVPEDFMFKTADGDPICANCLRNDFEALLSGDVLRCVNCSSFYFQEDSDGFGLCWDCSKELLTDCHCCGIYTFNWNNELGFSLCPECAGDVTSNSGVIDAIYDYWE